MIGVRLLYLLACLAAFRSLAAEPPVNGMVDRIAAHFEAASSRLRPEDADSLEQFVSRARNTPGARLALLVPITSEPARSRFVAARVILLQPAERSTRQIAECANGAPLLAALRLVRLFGSSIFLLPERAGCARGQSTSRAGVLPKRLNVSTCTHGLRTRLIL